MNKWNQIINFTNSTISTIIAKTRRSCTKMSTLMIRLILETLLNSIVCFLQFWQAYTQGRLIQKVVLLSGLYGICILMQCLSPLWKLNMYDRTFSEILSQSAWSLESPTYNYNHVQWRESNQGEVKAMCNQMKIILFSSRELANALRCGKKGSKIRKCKIAPVPHQNDFPN